MIVVFASIIPSSQVFVKVFGVGMVAAVLVDATIIRMLLVPAVMHLLGRGNWWLPRTMARRLPQLHIEGPPAAFPRPSMSRSRPDEVSSSTNWRRPIHTS